MQAYSTAEPRIGMIRSKMQEQAPQDMQQQNPGQTERPMMPEGNEPVMRVVMAAMKVMYSKGTSDGVVRMLQGENPAQALAGTTLFILQTLLSASKGSMPKELMSPAAPHILKLLAELAQAAGVQMTPEQVTQAEGLVQQRFGQQPAAQPAPVAPEEQAAVPVEEPEEV